MKFKKFFSWIAIIVTLLMVLFTVVDFFNTAGDIKDPNSQLAQMLPEERQFCLETLWSIDTNSTERDVLALLGKPSRSLKYKKNWWVILGGKKDRVGVYFDTSGHATKIVLDGGTGRFYYQRNVIDQENEKPEGPQQSDYRAKINPRPWESRVRG